MRWDEPLDVDLSDYERLERPGMTLHERAVQFAMEHREVHIRWRDHYRDHPPQTSAGREQRRRVGGVKHQETAIRRYNVILKALGELND